MGFYRGCAVDDAGRASCWGWRGRRDGLPPAALAGPVSAHQQRALNNTCPYEGLGQLYLLMGQADQARAVVDAPVFARPETSFRKHLLLGSLHMRAGEWSQAREALLQARALAQGPADLEEIGRLLEEVEAELGP